MCDTMQNQFRKKSKYCNQLCHLGQFHQLASNLVQEFGKHIGKGEVESSILSSSTISLY